MKIQLYLVSFLFLLGCTGESTNMAEANVAPVSVSADKQLNITILLDLSDRLAQEMQPSQAERDIEIVNSLLEVFKAEMEKKGAYLAKGKIRVLFDPSPADPNINALAQKLSIDLAAMDNKQKKKVYDNANKEFSESLREIYGLTLNSKNWVGSDTWRFFKNNAMDLSVDASDEYRNLLVVLTDGYLYHKQSVSRERNKTSYLTGVLLEKEGFRKNTNWQEKFEQGDYGLIDTKQNLEKLEVLVLEVNPSKAHVNDEDILRKYLSKWFEGMNISNYKIYNTDLPLNTKKRIDNFFLAKVPN